MFQFGLISRKITVLSEQRLQTIHNTHSTMTNLLDLRHCSVLEMSRHGRTCFVFLCLAQIEPLELEANAGAKWMHQSHLQRFRGMSGGN